MSDYLADVVLPPQPEPEPEPEPELVPSPQSKTLDLPEEEEDNFALRDDPLSDESEEEDVLPPEPVKKTKLKKEDIFKIKPTEKTEHLEIKEIVNKPVPIQKPKRKMTEKQLEGLAKGRLKRQENARIKNEEKDKIKYEKKKIRDQKEDAKEQRREERESRPPPPPKPETFTRKDLEDATFAAVERYDNRRKARKVVKKKEQAVKKHEDNLFKDINSQLGIGSQQQDDPWGQCFKF